VVPPDLLYFRTDEVVALTEDHGASDENFELTQIFTGEKRELVRE
jgi:hypothetical protein